MTGLVLACPGLSRSSRSGGVDKGGASRGGAENFPGCKALKTHKTGKESRRSRTATLPPPRMDKEGKRQRRAQPWLLHRDPLLTRERDQAAEAAVLLGVVIAIDVGQPMVEERVAEAGHDARAVFPRLGAEPERVEYRLDLALVEIFEIVADRGVGEQLAGQSLGVGAPRRPALGEPGMAEVEDE